MFCPKMLKFLKNKGFTLVESLIAVSLFSVAVLTLILSLGQSLSDTGYAKKKMTAEYLAQEGIEYIRNMRDTYVLFSTSPQTGWTDFNSKLTGASCQVANGCQFGDLSAGDYENQTMPMKDLAVNPCNSGTCPTLLYDSSTGKFNYSTGTNSDFIRTITSFSVNTNETRVSSTVFWTQKSGSYSVTFSESLYSWVE